VSACAESWKPIFGSEPADVAEIRDFCARSEQHEHPLVDRVDQDDSFAFLMFCEGLAYPSSRAFLSSLVDDAAERRVDIARGTPVVSQAVETLGLGIGARVEVELVLAVEVIVKGRRGEPVVLAVCSVPGVELVVLSLHGEDFNAAPGRILHKKTRPFAGTRFLLLQALGLRTQVSLRLWDVYTGIAP